MSLKMKDVVSANSASEFRSDVQLTDYRSPHNRDLVQGYIFTRKAVAQKKSSIDLLKHLCEAFTPGRNPNRFVFMATYGHGKSHLALALANFFGKKVSDLEFQSVLSNIEHAVNDPAYFGYFRSFKENKQPHLILLLSGIDQRDLPTQFYNSVEIALSEETAPKGVKLPFWYKGAEKFIEGINELTKPVANGLLEKQGLDLNILLERVKKQDSATLDICHNLCQDLYHTAPNFGAALNLREAIGWLCNNLCGNDKPYGGVLILFDEFSAFVRDYGLSMNSKPGTPLQDLLDGVDNSKEKAAFAAFSQHDPDSVARNVLHLSSTESLQNLLIQLNRLPAAQRYYLHSCLEEVLDAYLRQDSEKWVSLCRTPQFANVLYDANDVAIDVFSKRYISDLGWDSEHFQEVVTKGCFPLHPMTTALLSSVELQETTNPRSVLGFVLQCLDEITEEYAFHDGKPAWILPTTLVEYFKDMLGAEIWQDYIDAKFQAGGPDASQDEIAALKGMVLQKTANVQTRHFGFDKIIGQFAGLEKIEAGNALQHLAGRGVIRFDSVQNLYMFWPAGRGANKVEEILVGKTKSIGILNSDVLGKADTVLRRASLLGTHQVSVTWGQRDDWEAEEIMLSKENASVGDLRKLVLDRLQFKLDANDKVRGMVVWLVADTPDDVVWFREAFPLILSHEFPDSPLPVIFKRPRTFHANLATLLRRAYGLELFSNPEKQEVGKEQYDAVVSQNNINLKEAIGIMRSDSETEVLPLFMLRVKASPLQSLEQLLKEVYSLAYSLGPKKWFTQFKLSQIALKTATKILVGHLLQNTMDSPQALNASTIAKDAVDHFLKPEWGIVTADFRIKAPQPGAKASEGWELLDSYFAADAGSKSARKVLEQLINPPYGYDPYTVSILFSAWYGFNRQELEIVASNKLLSVDNLKTDPKELVKQLCEISIKRRNPNELKGKVRDIIKTLQTGVYDIDSAERAIKTLEEFIDNPKADEKEDAKKAREDLYTAVERARNYDVNINNIYSTLSRSTSIKDYFAALSLLKKLNFSSKVKPINAGISEVRSDIIKRISTEVASVCKVNGSISTISEFTLKHVNLSNLKKLLQKEDLSNLYSEVEQSIKNLELQKVKLEEKEKDKESMAFIQALPEVGKLVLLRSALTEIQEKSLYTEEARTLATKKIKSIQNEVERVLTFTTRLATRIESGSSSGELRKIEAELHRTQLLFEGAPEEAELNMMLDECSKKEAELSLIEVHQKAADEHDGPLLLALQGINVRNFSLSALEEELRTVSGFPFQTDIGRAKAKEKIKELNDEIDSLKSFISKIPYSLGNAESKDALRKLQFDLRSLKWRFQDTSGDAIVDSAITHCLVKLAEIETAERKEQERLDRDRRNKAELKSMLVSAPLSALTASLQRVAAMEITDDNVRRLADAKAAELTDEIERLKNLKTELAAKLDAVKNVDAVRALETQALKALSRLEETEEYDNLQIMLERCKKTEELLRLIEEGKRHQARNPVEFKEKVTFFMDLRARFSEVTGSNALAVLSETVAFIESNVQDQRTLAIAWITQQEKDLEEVGKPDLVLARLSEVPSFLPPEEMVRVDSLRSRAQQMVDDDQILQVEMSFTKICDPSKRRECLDRLQALVTKGN